MSRSMGRALRLGVKHTARLFDRLRPPPAGVTVLIYHRVGATTPVPVDLPESLFADQMAVLAESFAPATLDDAVGLLDPDVPHDPAAAPDQQRGAVPSVVVTFDDGTADVMERALPILVRHGIPMVLYLSTDFVEQGRSFPDEGRPTSWSALADGLTTGLVTIGSHTHTHRLLDRVDRSVAVEELDRSIALIEDRLDVPVRHFAYPKALGATGPVESEVRARFVSAALAGTRPNAPGATDLHRLARSPILRGDGVEWFTHKAAGGLRFEDDLRRVARARHYRDATT